MAELKVKMGNLELENPIIISSGHLTRTGEDVKRCGQYGAGAVITKSSFLEKEYQKVVKSHAPGLFPDARACFYPTGDGILSISGLSPIPVETWAKWFRDNVKEIKTPVIASLMALSVEGYIKGARLFQEAGAKAIEILLGCPLPYPLHHPYLDRSSFYTPIIEEICSEGRIVVSVHEKKCLGCGVCEEVCNWGAIKVDAIAEIEKEKCEGCSLCVCSCTQKALYLDGVDCISSMAGG